MSSESMPSSSDSGTDSAVQSPATRQRPMVHDLYGLVGIETPSATEAQISKSFEVMVNELLPKGPSNAAKAAFSVLTNPATRAQYDRDRLGYLYAHFKNHELFPADAAVVKNKSREEQIEIYAAILKQRISDPVENKKVEIHARLFRIRNELDEYKEKSKNVQEEWATSSNQILRLSAKALREVEISARADIEMLENELGDLRGQLLPKNIDGPPDRIASEHYGSDMCVQTKDKSLLVVNQCTPFIPRSPADHEHVRSASKFGMPMENSSTSDSSSSTSRSDSTRAIDDHIQEHMEGSVYGLIFPAPATHLDAGKRQSEVERINARATRPSSDLKMLSELAMTNSEKLLKQDEKAAFTGFDQIFRPEYDPSTKQKMLSHKPYGGIVKKEETSQRLATIGEISEHQEAQSACEAFRPKNETAQISTSSMISPSSSFHDQSPPGLGLVEYQQRFGCHIITENTQEREKRQVVTNSNKSAYAWKKIQKPSFSINDSVIMPAHLSSTRAGPHAGVRYRHMDDMDSPIDRPDRPFQRTMRGPVPIEPNPIGKLRTKPALSNISHAIMQQELRAAQPMSTKPSYNRDRTTMFQRVQEVVWERTHKDPTATEIKESQEHSFKKFDVGNNVGVARGSRQSVELKARDMAMQEALECSVSKVKKEEAARTLIELSRQGENASDSQQQRGQNVGNAIQDELTQPINLTHTGGQKCGAQKGGEQDGGPESHAAEHGGASLQSSIPYHYMDKHAQQHSSAPRPGVVHSTGPYSGPTLPTFDPYGRQEECQTGIHLPKPHVESASTYGAIGSEMKAMKDLKAQMEKVVAMDDIARD